MAKVDELIQQLCPDGVEYKPFYDVCSYHRGKTITQKSAEPGPIPVIAGGLSPAYTNANFNRDGESICIAGSGVYAGFVSFWREPIWVSDAFTVQPLDSAILLPRYLYLFLSSKQEDIYALKRGAGIPHVHGKDLSRLILPVPPLEVQQEIVRILDAFTELEANLQRELDARKRQYEHYRDVLLSQGTQSTAVAFEFACKSMNTGPFGSSVHKGDYVDTGIPIINPKDIVDGAIAVGAMVSADTAERLSAYRLNEGDIIIGRRGEMGRAAVVDEATAGSLCGTGCFFVRPDNKRALPDYWNHYFRSPLVRSYLEQNAVGGTMKNLNLSILGKMPVYLPPLEVQREIVDKLDAMVALQDNLQRQIDLTHRQYEHYRDQLLDLPRKEA